MFEVKNLWFHYGSKNVLQDVNFSLGSGKFFSIIGPNGSGKTTLINLLTGYLKTDTGKISVFKRPIETYPLEQLARFFAIIHQGVSIKFPFTCLEIVMMGRHPFTRRMNALTESDMAIAYEAMSLTDTLEFSDRLVTEISGGEFQRVMFARAVAQKPQVLFLDEAFSEMDISHRIRSLKLIKGLVQQEQLTVIAIMHDLNLAYTFSDDVIALKEGRIQGNNSPQKLMTAAFLKAVFDIHVHHVEDKGFIVIPE